MNDLSRVFTHHHDGQVTDSGLLIQGQPQGLENTTSAESTYEAPGLG